MLITYINIIEFYNFKIKKIIFKKVTLIDQEDFMIW